MKVLKGNYGECRFCDNIDTDYGLPSLKEKSWDLCLTDPPYGINYKDKHERHNSIHYNDSELKPEWLNVALLKAKGVYFTCGVTNLFNWVIWQKPNYTLRGFYYPDAGGYFHLDYLLGYGYIPNITKLRDMSIQKTHKYDGFKHPDPKPLGSWNYILNKLEPTSVLDPFLGSGTTAQVCEHLGIPWLGYEIMEEYAPDIEKRIKKGIVEHSRYNPPKKRSQLSLESFQERIHTVSNGRGGSRDEGSQG